MNTDQFHEITNGPDTYRTVAHYLHMQGSVLIGWTDEAGTHFDILFTKKPFHAGPIQGGLKPYKDLFVSIMRIGAFAFEIGENQSSPGYISEKLTFSGEETARKLAELVNGVRKELKF